MQNDSLELWQFYFPSTAYFYLRLLPVVQNCYTPSPYFWIYFSPTGNSHK